MTFMPTDSPIMPLSYSSSMKLRRNPKSFRSKVLHRRQEKYCNLTIVIVQCCNLDQNKEMMNQGMLCILQSFTVKLERTSKSGLKVLIDTARASCWSNKCQIDILPAFLSDRATDFWMSSP